MFANKIHEKAHLLFKDGKLNESILLFTEALVAAPNHLDILSDRGVAYLHLKEEDKCFEDLNLAIELQPDYAFRYACRAFAKRHFGDLEGAIIDYEKAVNLDPEDSIAHNNLGLLLEEKGYQTAAEKRFKRADKLSKQEDQLLGVIDEIDKKEELETKNELPLPQEKEPIDPRSAKASEFKKIFTSMKQFKEFIQFMKNGFRINKK